MERFKRLLKDCFSYVGELLLTHPVTFVTLAVGTVLGVMLALTESFHLEGDRLSQATTIITQLMAAAVVFAAFAFFIESSPVRSKMKMPLSVVCYLTGGIISFVLGSVCCYDLHGESERKYILQNGVFDSICSVIGSDRLRNITIGLCVAFAAMGIYYSYRKLKDVSFSAYLTNLFSKLFFANIVFWALSGGVGILTVIFTELIWGEFGDIFLPIFALIVGGYYVMRVVSCYTEPYKEPNVFITVLLKYVMFIMCLIAYVIIYIYMIKITVTRSYPSNAVFEILTSLFTVSMPVAFMCRSLVRKSDGAAEASKAEGSITEDAVTGNTKTEDSITADAITADIVENDNALKTPAFIVKAVEYMPFIFIPFIFLQIYSSGVRIMQYGLTPRRYFGILFVIIEIITIVLYAVFKDKDEKKISSFLAVTAVCAIVSTVFPFINAIDLSRSVQLNNIRAYLKNPDNENKNLMSRAGAGYNYLKDDEKGILLAKFTENEIEIVKNISADKSVSREWDYETHIYWDDYNKELNLDISDYENMKYGYLGTVGLKDGKPDASEDADLTHMGLFTDGDGTLPSYPSINDLYEKASPEAVFDLSDFTDDLFETAKKYGDDTYSDACDEELREMQLIELDNGDAFYIRDLEIHYIKDTDEICEVMFRGFYLEK
ncbi:MAG: DUF4153 domain-containing protein [Lachnospiraceae bacterium]|nr:DUF4153 domain-containing protein [Lachnospiraceae bacterium]